MKEVDESLVCIKNAFLKSNIKHRYYFKSTHEGYAVIKEELEELWEAVKKDDYLNCVEEAEQIGAMALKFLLSFNEIEAK